MSNDTNEIPRRHTGLVAYVEILQLASVISIGAMLLWPMARLRDAVPPDYAVWAWLLFIFAALAGAIVPFFVKPAEVVNWGTASAHSWASCVILRPGRRCSTT